MNLSYSLKY